MVWFLIEGYRDSIPELVKAGVVVIETAVGHPRVVRGISFPEEHLGQVGEILSLSPHINRQETERKGVYLLEGPQVILADSSDMSQWESFASVLEEYSARWGQNINVRNPHGNDWVLRNPQENTLYIAFWSAPNSREKHSFGVIELFGHQVQSNQADGFEHNDELPEEQLIIDEDDTVIAEVHGNVLYVLFDLPHRGVNPAPIMRCIMEEWELILLEDDQYRARIESRDVLETTHARVRYIAACKKRVDAELREVQKDLEQTRERHKEYRQVYIDTLREAESLTRTLNNLQSNTADIESTYESEYDRLSTNPKLENVTIRGDVISFYTHPLVTARLRDGTIRDLGAYVIRVNIESGMVRIDNRTRKIGGRNHPHDMEKGRLCLGNMTEAITRLTAMYQFEQLFALMIRFLENPNEGESMGSQIFHWPIYEEERT